MQRMTVFAFFVCLVFAQVACNRSSNQAKAPQSAQEIMASIPKLLDRAPAIRNGKEWDDVQNFYAAQCRELMQKPTALEPQLKLSELYINEARITGEHPHYYPAALSRLDIVLQALQQKGAQSIQDKDLMFRALSNKASVQLSLHSFADALQTAEAAVAINPYNAQIYGALVDAHVELGHYAQAVEMADKMVSIRPDLRSYSRVSYLREIHGDVAGAIEALEMAVKAGFPGQESTAWARLTLGNLYKTYGNSTKAEMEYRAILEERPDYPFALAALGELALEQKRYGDAEPLLKKASEIIPEVGFFESLAQIYRDTKRQGEYEALLPEIEKMMAEDTEKGHNMSLEFAQFYLELKPDLDKALQYALSEYAKRSDNIDVNRLLAHIYAAKNDAAKTKEHFAKALVTNSKHPELADLKKMFPG